MAPGDQEQPDPSPHGLQDEKTKEKIHKHLTDKDDVISEEDIKNARTDIKSEDHPLTKNNAEEEGQQDDEDNEERPKSEPPSSWEIIE